MAEPLLAAAEETVEELPFTPPSSPTRSGRGIMNSSRQPFLIGVAGGTASGKTSVCHKIMQQLELADNNKKRVVVVSQDSFYKKIESRDRKLVNQGDYNFDHPGMCVCHRCSKVV